MASEAGGGPSKRKRTKGGRYSHEITKQEIEGYFHLPCEEASRQLGIGLTILKRICRRLGIEKWPYRQLKRAGRLPEVAAANSNLPSPFQTSGLPELGSTSGQPLWGQLQAGRTASSGSSGSGGSAPDAAAGGQPPAWLLAANGIMPAQGQLDVLAPAAPQQAQQPAAPPRRRSTAGEGGFPRRKSLDKGATRATARSGSPDHSSSSNSGGSHSAGGSGGMQRAASIPLKRIREEDVMLSNLDSPSNPFAMAAMASAGPSWESGGWAGASGGGGQQGGGGGDGADTAAADQLASGLSRLRMRTLSLKRQCSRGDAGLDALDQALLLERVGAQQPQLMPSIVRACSMPAHASIRRGSPPLPPCQQQHPGPAAPLLDVFGSGSISLPPYPRPGQPGPTMVPQHPSPLSRQHRRPPSGPQHRQQAASQAQVQAQQFNAPASPFASLAPFGVEEGQLAGHGQGAALESIPEPTGMGLPPVSSDASLSALFANALAPHKRNSGGSEAISEGCLLPEQAGPEGESVLFAWEAPGEAGAAAAAAAAACHPRSGSSGLLLHSSGSGSMLLHHPGLAAPDAALERDAGRVHAWQQQQLAAAASGLPSRPGSTKPAQLPAAAVGPAQGECQRAADVLSPFSVVSGAALEDQEVDNLLADFLSPDLSDPASDPLRLLEPLSPFSAAMTASPTAQQQQQQQQLQQGSYTAALLSDDDATLAALAAAPPAAHVIAAAAADPLSAGLAVAGPAVKLGMVPVGDHAAEGGSGGCGGKLDMLSVGSQQDGNGSGSVVSFDTPTSTGTSAVPPCPAIDLPCLPPSSTTDVAQLAAMHANDPDPVKQLLASQLLQLQQQAAQAAQQQQQGQEPQQPQAQQHAPLPAQQQQQQQAASAAAAVAVSLPSPTSPASSAEQQLWEAQQQYLVQRQEVQRMLQQRGQMLQQQPRQPGISVPGDQERLRQLLRLKQLKQQLAAAQARQNALEQLKQQRLALQQQQEALEQQQAQLRQAQLALQQQQQQQAQGQQQCGQVQSQQQQRAQQAPAPEQQQEQQQALQQEQAMLRQQALLNDVSSAFTGGAPRLGPPPPLPANVGLLSSAGQPQQQAKGVAALQQVPPRQSQPGVEALFEQWSAEAAAEKAPVVVPIPAAKWPSLQPSWGLQPQQQQQQRQQQSKQVRLGTSAAQRAASAPLPWDLDWAAML